MTKKVAILFLITLLVLICCGCDIDPGDASFISTKKVSLAGVGDLKLNYFRDIYIYESENTDNELIAKEIEGSINGNLGPFLSVNDSELHYRSIRDYIADIQLPATYNQNLMICSEYGVVTCCPNLFINKLDIQANSSVHVNTVHAQEVTISCIIGEITGKEIRSKKIKITSAEANTVIEYIKGSIDITTIKGNIIIQQLLGGGKVISESGDISILINDLSENLYIETLSGNVELNFAPSLEFMLEATTDKGIITLPDGGAETIDNNITYTYNSGNATGILVKIVSMKGNITIKQEK